jgi:hypothetical protein
LLLFEMTDSCGTTKPSWLMGCQLPQEHQQKDAKWIRRKVDRGSPVWRNSDLVASTRSSPTRLICRREAGFGPATGDWHHGAAKSVAEDCGILKKLTLGFATAALGVIGARGRTDEVDMLRERIPQKRRTRLAMCYHNRIAVRHSPDGIDGKLGNST